MTIPEIPGAHILPLECPACGYTTTHMASPYPQDEGKPPIQGCWSICVKCGCISEIMQDMSLRVVQPTELGNPDYAEAKRLQLKIRKMRGLPAFS